MKDFRDVSAAGCNNAVSQYRELEVASPRTCWPLITETSPMAASNECPKCQRSRCAHGRCVNQLCPLREDCEDGGCG